MSWHPWPKSKLKLAVGGWLQQPRARDMRATARQLVLNINGNAQQSAVSVWFQPLKHTVQTTQQLLPVHEGVYQ
eukprot:3103792-Karenia_brevis.AAC.1